MAEIWLSSWKQAESGRKIGEGLSSLSDGSKKEARASSMASSRFKNGLAAEVRSRMDSLGSTMAAVVGALEMERERIPATSTVSSLQQLCSKYSSDFKLLGKRRQSG